MQELVIFLALPFLGVFAGEAERVGLGDVERREGGVGYRGSDGAERRVLVVRGNAARGLVRDELRDVLVAVVEIEEVVRTRGPLHPQGPRRDRLGRIPAKVKVVRRVRQREGDALCVAAQVGDAGIVRDDVRGIDGQIDEHGREKIAEKRKGERDGKREALQTAAGCIRHVQTPFGHVAENATDKLAPPRPERAPPV